MQLITFQMKRPRYNVECRRQLGNHRPVWSKLALLEITYGLERKSACFRKLFLRKSPLLSLVKQPLREPHAAPPMLAKHTRYGTPFILAAWAPVKQGAARGRNEPRSAASLVRPLASFPRAC